MTRTVILLALSAMPCFVGMAIAADDPGFRVRADFSAPLNADTGWAAELNENVSVTVDRPFRLRFEVELTEPVARQDGLRLQYRRNEGDWAPVEAHDFPYPLREVEIDFSDARSGVIPEDWRVASGENTSITVAKVGELQVMRASAGAEALIALYPPPWDLDEFSFATEYRLPTDGNGQLGIVFGYVDADNHWRLLLDTNAGRVHVSRFVDGTESLITERSAGLVAGKWQEVEVKVEAGRLEVNVGDDAPEFFEPVGDSVPQSDLGFFVPSQGQVEFRTFVIEGLPSAPPVSIVSTDAYSHGEATRDLLRGATSRFEAGTGVSIAEHTPAWNGSGRHGEFEWPLVIRRFADRAVIAEDGDTFEFRMTDASGNAINRNANPLLTLEVPAYHLGGTFVETPGRIGPWQTSNGDLYFIMEPTESDNLFMVVKSTDGGRSWREVGGENRPATGDLESVDGQLVDGTIHMVHQVTGATLHHAFRTSDHPTHPDTWELTDELATRVIARVQMASTVVRSDGSMVIFHLGNTIGYAVRSPTGEWSDEVVIGGNDGV